MGEKEAGGVKKGATKKRGGVRESGGVGRKGEWRGAMKGEERGPILR